MEKPKFLIIALNLLSLLCFSIAEIESPQYAVVHTESDFEIRLYRNSTWVSALSTEISFEKATLFGFHRLFEYVQGANLNFSRIPLTTPILTSIVPGAGPFGSSAYYVRLYLPEKFQDEPPLPIEELGLETFAWPSHCVAVRKFCGFAKDDNIVKQAQKLAISLSRSPWANLTSTNATNAYSIAQYDPPFRVIGRTNEVWADIAASVEANCNSTSGIASF